jgi:hypothetical protein
MDTNYIVKNLADAELAGCLLLKKDLNIFELLRDDLTNRIALYLRMPTAKTIKEAIITESAAIKQVPYWEYIINELQYELRMAAFSGKLNPAYEAMMINDWAKHIIRKEDADTSLDFIILLKANRLKRTRSIALK